VNVEVGSIYHSPRQYHKNKTYKINVLWDYQNRGQRDAVPNM